VQQDFNMDNRPQRLVPDRPLPPYTFVPGQTPHPVRDPAGHLYGRPIETPPPLDPAHWQASQAYLYGIDLFNHGYYWEAHEAWEGLWHRAGRQGLVADFLKGLIKLAAAGVKLRQGVPRGVAAHAAGAAELFRQTAAALGANGARLAGLALDDLLDFAARAERLAANVPDQPQTGVQIVFDFVLRPTAKG
jgi:predicted metal-dependent hydrolase